MLYFEFLPTHPTHKNKSAAETLFPVSQNMTLSRDRVYSEVIKLKQGNEGGPGFNMTEVLIQREIGMQM